MKRILHGTNRGCGIALRRGSGVCSSFVRGNLRPGQKDKDRGNREGVHLAQSSFVHQD